MRPPTLSIVHICFNNFEVFDFLDGPRGPGRILGASWEGLEGSWGCPAGSGRLGRVLGGLGGSWEGPGVREASWEGLERSWSDLGVTF